MTNDSHESALLEHLIREHLHAVSASRGAELGGKMGFEKHTSARDAMGRDSDSVATENGFPDGKP
jgi:hypothetical protein